MKKVYLIIAIFATTLFAEQSVYSDADFIDATTMAKSNSREIFKLKEQISQLKEEIEGLKSLINGQAEQIAKLKQKSDNSSLEKVVNELSQRVATLESKPPQVIKEQVKVEKDNSAKIDDTKNKKETQKEEISLSKEELYKQSVLNFTKSRLTKAKDGFKKLLKKGYKKASVNFYLGEIAYKQKRYKDAISYYQTSASIDDGASYMDKLLFHTAIALEKKGKKNDAKMFFQAIVDGYPNSKLYKEAKAHLK